MNSSESVRAFARDHQRPLRMLLSTLSKEDEDSDQRVVVIDDLRLATVGTTLHITGMNALVPNPVYEDQRVRIEHMESTLAEFGRINELPIFERNTLWGRRMKLDLKLVAPYLVPQQGRLAVLARDQQSLTILELHEQIELWTSAQLDARPSRYRTLLRTWTIEFVIKLLSRVDGAHKSDFKRDVLVPLLDVVQSQLDNGNLALQDIGVTDTEARERVFEFLDSAALNSNGAAVSLAQLYNWLVHYVKASEADVWASLWQASQADEDAAVTAVAQLRALMAQNELVEQMRVRFGDARVLLESDLKTLYESWLDSLSRVQTLALVQRDTESYAPTYASAWPSDDISTEFSRLRLERHAASAARGAEQAIFFASYNSQAIAGALTPRTLLTQLFSSWSAITPLRSEESLKHAIESAWRDLNENYSKLISVPLDVTLDFALHHEPSHLLEMLLEYTHAELEALDALATERGEHYEHDVELLTCSNDGTLTRAHFERLTAVNLSLSTSVRFRARVPGLYWYKVTRRWLDGADRVMRTDAVGYSFTAIVRERVLCRRTKLAFDPFLQRDDRIKWSTTTLPELPDAVVARLPREVTHRPLTRLYEQVLELETETNQQLRAQMVPLLATYVSDHKRLLQERIGESALVLLESALKFDSVFSKHAPFAVNLDAIDTLKLMLSEEQNEEYGALSNLWEYATMARVAYDRFTDFMLDGIAAHVASEFKSARPAEAGTSLGTGADVKLREADAAALKQRVSEAVDAALASYEGRTLIELRRETNTKPAFAISSDDRNIMLKTLARVESTLYWFQVRQLVGPEREWTGTHSQTSECPDFWRLKFGVRAAAGFDSDLVHVYVQLDEGSTMSQMLSADEPTAEALIIETWLAWRAKDARASDARNQITLLENARMSQLEQSLLDNVLDYDLDADRRSNLLDKLRSARAYIELIRNYTSSLADSYAALAVAQN